MGPPLFVSTQLVTAPPIPQDGCGREVGQKCWAKNARRYRRTRTTDGCLTVGVSSFVAFPGAHSLSPSLQAGVVVSAPGATASAQQAPFRVTVRVEVLRDSGAGE